MLSYFNLTLKSWLIYIINWFSHTKSKTLCSEMLHMHRKFSFLSFHGSKSFEPLKFDCTCLFIRSLTLEPVYDVTHHNNNLEIMLSSQGFDLDARLHLGIQTIINICFLLRLSVIFGFHWDCLGSLASCQITVREKWLPAKPVRMILLFVQSLSRKQNHMGSLARKPFITDNRHSWKQEISDSLRGNQIYCPNKKEIRLTSLYPVYK